MSFFTSEYDCKLDTKGRLTLPAKIKANLPEVSTDELMLRMGFESNLILYPMMEYRKIHAKIAALSEFDPEQRTLKRMFFRSIAQVEMDNAGRILIPRNMLGHAGIDKDVLMVGMGNYLEMWDPLTFEKNLGGSGSNFSELAHRFLDN